jgi:hypothetical protein
MRVRVTKLLPIDEEQPSSAEAFAQLLPLVAEVPRAAASVVTRIDARCAQPAYARLKADNSPVTKGAEQAEAQITAPLQRLLPGSPAGRGGTREFLLRSGEFTVEHRAHRARPPCTRRSAGARLPEGPVLYSGHRSSTLPARSSPRFRP